MIRLTLATELSSLTLSVSCESEFAFSPDTTNTVAHAPTPTAQLCGRVQTGNYVCMTCFSGRLFQWPTRVTQAGDWCRDTIWRSTIITVTLLFPSRNKSRQETECVVHAVLLVWLGCIYVGLSHEH